MNRYQVLLTQTVTERAYVEVEAENEDAAMQAAEQEVIDGNVEFTFWDNQNGVEAIEVKLARDAWISKKGEHNRE